MNIKEKILIIICLILSIIIIFNIFIIEVSIVKVIKDYNLKEEKLELETSRDFCSRDLFTDQLIYLVNEQLVYANLDEKNIYNDIVNKDSENTFKKYFESKGWKFSIRLHKSRAFIRLNRDDIRIIIGGDLNYLESTIFKEYFMIDTISIYPDEPGSEYATSYTNEYTFSLYNDAIYDIFKEKYELKDYINYMANQKEEFNDIILDEQRPLNDDEYEIINQMAEVFNDFIEDYKIFLNNKC